MQIKNYIVDNIEVVIDFLERMLCQEGISYVRIDNEFHFNNQIIILYDLELHKDIIRAWTFKQALEEITIIEEPFMTIGRGSDMLYKPVNDGFLFFEEEKNYNPRKKNTYKQESKRVKQIMKNYKR